MSAGELLRRAVRRRQTPAEEEVARPFPEMLTTLKRVSAALRDAGIDHALAGAPACWARGGPDHGDDLDFLLAPRDAERALAVLAEAGMRTERPPEGWLVKAWDGDLLVDLITHPIGVDAEEALARTTEMRVGGMPIRVCAVEDVLTSVLLARNEVYLDFVGPLRVVRALREQIDWADLRLRTAGSPYARGFLALCEELEIIAPARSLSAVERARAG
jgi:hypothetical protein